jgi:hypothetical protein
MAWQRGKKITALWSINEPDNAWAWVDGLGWRKCDRRTNTTSLLILAATAKGGSTFVDFNEETVDGRATITEIYVW